MALGVENELYDQHIDGGVVFLEDGGLFRYYWRLT